MNPTRIVTVLLTFLLCASCFAVPPGTMHWMCQAGTVEESLMVPAIGDDGTVYVTSRLLIDPLRGKNGRLHAVWPNGQKRWDFNPENQPSTSPVIADDGTVYFVSSLGVYPGCCSRAWLHAISTNGYQQWVWQGLARDIFQPAVGADGTIYCAARYDPGYVGSNGLYALRPDGSVKWRFRVTNDVGNLPPTIAPDGTIYWGTPERFFALNPDGTKLWELPFRDAYACIREDGYLYLPGILALNPDGIGDWGYTTGGEHDATIVIGPGGIITAGGRTVNPDGSSTHGGYGGSTVSVAAYSADRTYYSAGGSSVTANSPGFIWQFTFPYGPTYSGPVLTADGILYCGAGGGQLYAFQGFCGLANTSWPMSWGNPKRNGRIYPATALIRPTLQPLRLLNNRGYQLLLRGEFGTHYAVETSPDLSTWTTWTNVYQTNYITHLTDSDATNSTKRFYRAKKL